MTVYSSFFCSLWTLKPEFEMPVGSLIGDSRVSLRISESGVQRETGTGCNIWSHESGNDI